VLLLVARLIVGGALAIEGLRELAHVNQLATVAAVRGLPGELVPLAAGALLIAAVHLVLGVMPRFGLLMAFSMLLAAAPQLHAFWRVAEGPAREAERFALGRSVLILAAWLLFLLPPAPWPYSVDGVYHRRAGPPSGRPLTR
jgi:uncharacterized membrane protein YphA (DoxX/SURF4 family)